MIYEVFSYGKEPYEGMDPREVFTNVFQEGERLSPPGECRSPWSSIMPQCFHLNPEKRPNFQTIKTQTHGGSE